MRYRTPEGTFRTRTFRRRADAERFRSTTEVDLSAGDWIDPRRGRTTLAEWVEQWWATTVDLRPSSRARDESYLRSQILPVFGDWPLSSIDHLSVRTWVAELSSRRQPATVHKAVGILRKVLADAVDGGLIARNPVERVRLPRIERREMRFLTPAEVADLADAIDPRYRATVILGAYGGLRAGNSSGSELTESIRSCSRCTSPRSPPTFEAISISVHPRPGPARGRSRFPDSSLTHSLSISRRFRRVPMIWCFLLRRGVTCDSSFGVVGFGLRRSNRPGSRRFVPTISVTRPWRCGSPLVRRPRRSLLGPVIPVS